MTNKDQINKGPAEDQNKTDADKNSTKPGEDKNNPGTEPGGPESDDQKADEWGEESFPGSDAPANY